MATIRAPSGISFGAQAVRVAVAAVALVVVQDDRHGLLERGGLLQDHLADARMLDDRPPLGRRQRGRLLEDVLRDGDLADVVQQRRDPDPVHFGVRQFELSGERDDDRGDERRRLAAVVGERVEHGRQGQRGGLARLLADRHRVGPSGRRDRGSRDPGVVVGFGEHVRLVAPERLRRVHRGVRVAHERVHPQPGPVPPAMPIEIVTDRPGLPSTANRWRWTSVRSFSVSTAPSSTSVSVRMSMNSSPPYRPIRSEARRFSEMVWATPRRTTSPAAWP